MVLNGTSVVWTTKKKIAAGLLVLSFILFFFPWMTISVNVFGVKYTIPKIMEFVYSDNRYTKEEFEADLRKELEDASEEMEEEGVAKMSVSRAMGIYKAVTDSGISPLDAARTLGFTGNLFGQINRYIDKNRDDMGSDMFFVSIISGAAGKLKLAAVVMWLLVLGTAAAFVFSLLNILRDNKLGTIPYLCVSLIMLIAFMVVTAKANSGIKQLADTFSYLASDIGELIGVGAFSLKAVKIFHLGFAGILSALCAAGATGVLMYGGGMPELSRIPNINIPKINIPKINVPKIVTGRKWTCPSCGAEMSADAAFCINCGTKRPEAPRCAGCGRPLEKDVAFCPQCGTPVADRMGDRSVVAPAPPRQPPRCAGCGRPLEKGVAFCPKCGTPADSRGRQQPAPAKDTYRPTPAQDSYRTAPAKDTYRPAPAQDEYEPVPGWDAEEPDTGWDAEDPDTGWDAEEPDSGWDVDETVAGSDRDQGDTVTIKTCPVCRSAVPSGDDVCPSCGHRFSGTSKLWGSLAKPGGSGDSGAFSKPGDDDL